MIKSIYFIEKFVNTTINTDQEHRNNRMTSPESLNSLCTDAYNLLALKEIKKTLYKCLPTASGIFSLTSVRHNINSNPSNANDDGMITGNITTVINVYPVSK